MGPRAATPARGADVVGPVVDDAVIPVANTTSTVVTVTAAVAAAAAFALAWSRAGGPGPEEGEGWLEPAAEDDEDGGEVGGQDGNEGLAGGPEADGVKISLHPLCIVSVCLTPLVSRLDLFFVLGLSFEE